MSGLRYPGLPDDPSYQIASRQMRRYGCVVSFMLPDRDRAERFLDGLRLVDDATSFGGVRSTAERRGRWGGDAVPEGFIRFSVGAEDPEDLVADVLRALDERRKRRGEPPYEHGSTGDGSHIRTVRASPLVARAVLGSPREEPAHKAS